MIGFWRPAPPDPGRHVVAVWTAVLHGQRLLVEHCDGEPCWHWMVLSQHGHEIECGSANDAASAELEAEEAAFHIHPPTLGDWLERLM